MKRFQLSAGQTLALFIFILLFAFDQFAQNADGLKNAGQTIEYFGKLDAELVPDMKNIYGSVFAPAGDSLAKYKFVRSIENGATVTVGKLFYTGASNNKYEVLLVEPPKESPYFYADLNANGTLEETERLPLAPAKDETNDFEQILKVPVANALFKSFPVYLRFKRGFKNPKLKTGERIVRQSAYAYATGEVRINNRNVLVLYSFDPTVSALSTTEGLFGIDVDGDRIIKNEPFSPETSYASKAEIVFRFGNLYLSTSRIDLEKNQIVIRQRAAAEYLREDLEIGRPMPDFSFVDFENKKRTLSEFRGKYLLVDFWGLWCVDCHRELPFQMAAYRRFRGRGFEILGMDSDEMEKFEEVKTFLTKNQINWPQARFDSIKNLIDVTYRIQEYPSAILLDPEGKILVLDQRQLTGERLLETLDKILPR